MPALINTIIMTGLSLIIAGPLGIFAAIYLVEYAKRGNKLVALIRITAAVSYTHLDVYKRQIVTCDNGIAALDQIALAKELGLTVVVTDHHEVVRRADGSEQLPCADAVSYTHLDVYKRQGAGWTEKSAIIRLYLPFRGQMEIMW